MIPIITIEGPTASGKSELALNLARILNTEIISADSRQVYKYLDIGTAKPPADALEQVKHHLISIIEPDESFNVGLFCSSATQIVKALNQEGKIPIICGGTGLYVKSLLEGLFPLSKVDTRIRADLRQELEEKGLSALFTELQNVDACLAAKINANDRQRVLRALEVFRSTGIPVSEHWHRQEKRCNYFPYRILLSTDRKDLYDKINRRILWMIINGLIEEISSLLENGFTWDAPGFNSLGYKEFRPYIDGVIGLEQCVALAQQHTRNYAKRQITWYRNCTFHLTQPSTSINISRVGDEVRRFFERNNSGEIDGSSCSYT